MFTMWKELMNYRELLIAFTWRNIQIKYKQTFLGFLWALFMPILIILSGVFVRVGIAKMSGLQVNAQEIASVTVKSLPWAFFIGALKFSVGSLVANMEIVKKIYFPRVIFPLSYTFGQLFDFLIAATFFALFLVFFKLGATIYLLWLPILLILLVLYTAGLGMILSCGNLFYRDVKYIVDVVLTFAIFFTPVFYEAHVFGRWAPLIMLNPVASLLECINAVIVLKMAPSAFWLSYATVASIVTFIIGWAVFHAAEPSFAENI